MRRRRGESATSDRRFCIRIFLSFALTRRLVQLCLRALNLNPFCTEERDVGAVLDSNTNTGGRARSAAGRPFESFRGEFIIQEYNTHMFFVFFVCSE
jgi:hypothetical protein